MSGIQDWIYHWSEGAGARTLKFVLLLLAVVALAALYDLRAYKNWGNPEAMETAQLARNLAEGKGYSTQVVRPFAHHLLRRQADRRADEALKQLPAERAQWTPAQRQQFEALIRPGMITDANPDITHAPVYPALLAGFMRLAPFEYTIKSGERFVRYQPEFLIALLNQLLFFLVVWLTFCLARDLFDGGVAWLTAVALLGSELFWRISLAGVSTMVLMVLLLLLVRSLVALEQGAEEFRGGWRMYGLALVAGLLLGLGILTRYSFAWLAVPVIVFMAAYLGARRAGLLMVTLVVAAAVVAPWLWRNHQLSGAFFGTAGYAVYEGTASFPATILPRSLNPVFTRIYADDLPAKLVEGCREIVSRDLPQLGGSWIGAFFLVGLLVPFKSPSLSRLRLFVLGGLGLLTAAQALGATPFHAAHREISTENLLVLMAPLAFMYGAGLFSTLLDQARASVWEVRPLFVGGFVLVAAAPLALALLPPRPSPLAYPPYFPPDVQKVARWMQPEEFMMSDIPWAVAWYGNRTCAWLPLNAQEDYLALHRQRPIQALYLTRQTMDNRFFSQWVEGENQGWGRFMSDLILRQEAPTGFPLVEAFADRFPEQIFLTDRPRWGGSGK